MMSSVNSENTASLHALLPAEYFNMIAVKDG